MRRPVYVILGLLVMILLVKWLSSSLFFTAPRRLQILVYGQDSRVYSIDTRGNNHYIIHFAPDERIGVPGGYGYYRVGALGKLVALQKDDQIMGKAFSVASSSFVTHYFYPPDGAIYNGQKVSGDIVMPTVAELFSYRSNANIFDRLYLSLHFGQVKKNDYLLLRSRGDSQDRKGMRVFVPENFSKETEGYIYNTTYRDERKTVQLIYTEDYNSARDIANILEGNGIRVVDIKKLDREHSKCTISDVSESDTSRAIGRFFGCSFKAGRSQVSDILFDMRGIEQMWQTN